MRLRLRWVSLGFLVIHTIGYLGSFSIRVPLPPERIWFCLAMLMLTAVIWTPIQFSARQLLVAKVMLVSITLSYLLGMGGLSIAFLAKTGEIATVTSNLDYQVAGGSLLIVIYSLVLPHSWRETASLALPLAILLYCYPGFLSLVDDNIAVILAQNRFDHPIPLPFVAAAFSMVGAYVVESNRKAVFQLRQFHQYRLVMKLGEGGMGEIYLAEHRMLKRSCALKLIRPEQVDEAALVRFEREVKATAELTHPHAVKVFDYGRTEEGTFYYVMELLPGKNLGDLVETHGRISPERTIHFLRQTCGALAEAHSKGLIHRDLKPHNIFASERGGLYDYTKLLDFGLVKTPKKIADNVSTVSDNDGITGSPYFIAPEQARDFTSVDERTDIYALGAVGYFLVTGKPPFVRENLLGVVMAHVLDPVDPPSQLHTDVPGDLEAILLKCLEKDPDARYQTAESLEQALSECEHADLWTYRDAKQWWTRIHTDVPGDLEAILLKCLEKDPDARYQTAESLEQALSECEHADLWTYRDAKQWWTRKTASAIEPVAVAAAVESAS